MKVVFLVVLCAVLLAPAAADQSYWCARVTYGDLVADVYGWLSHDYDSVWTAPADYLDRPAIALDGGGVKYSNLGLGTESWEAYFWAGYHMPVDAPYEVTVTAYFPIFLVAKMRNGDPIFQKTLNAQETYSWQVYAVPATTAQWRTKGTELVVTPMVPEPSSGILLLGLPFFSGFYRRRKLLNKADAQ